jgi:putative ABC transport system permease protein
MDSLLQDLRYGIKMLLKRPRLTVAALLALALSIGATSVIFSVVNAVLLRPLPLNDPDRLMFILSTRRQEAAVSGTAAHADYLDWKEQNTVFEDLSTFYAGGFKITGMGDPEDLEGADVSASFFKILKIQPILGRDFIPGEDDVDAPQSSVLITYEFWQRLFNKDPNIVGQPLTLEGKPRMVIGILPPGFKFPLAEKAEIYGLITYDAFDAKRRGNRSLHVIGRLKPGVTRQMAQADMDPIAARLEQQYPTTNTGRIVIVTSFLGRIVEKIRPALLLLLGVVGFVLLIACSNVAHLTLAGTAARQKEMAIRSALGASRGRIVRQLLTESLILSVAGGVAGLVLAMGSVRLLVAISPGNIPRLNNVSVDWRVVIFTLVVSVGTAVVFGLAPAVMASKPDVNEALKESGGVVVGVGRRTRMRSVLVVTEVAMVLVLLIGAGLLMRSFQRLQQIQPGFDYKNILTLRVALPLMKFEKAGPFFQEVANQIEAVPGVESVGAITQLPLSDESDESPFKSLRTIMRISDRPTPEKGNEPRSEVRCVTAGYFRTMRIPMVKGREFTEEDVVGKPGAIIINEALALREWPDENPIGKKMSIGIRHYSYEPREWEIVGIVRNVRHFSLDAEPVPEMYVPHHQQQWPFLTFTIRTTSDPMTLVNAIRKQIWSVDKDLPVSKIQTMQSLVDQQVAQPRFYLKALAIFAGVALVLASVGIYGVMSHMVTQRTHEIGVRMAMGAQNRDVMTLMIRQGVALILISALIGLASASAVTRIMRGLLYGVSSTDPLIFVVTPLLLIGVAVVASYIPARRATKVDPQVALRYE